MQSKIILNRPGNVVTSCWGKMSERIHNLWKYPRYCDLFWVSSVHWCHASLLY